VVPGELAYCRVLLTVMIVVLTFAALVTPIPGSTPADSQFVTLGRSAP
jgi:hypothetical protein